MTFKPENTTAELPFDLKDRKQLKPDDKFCFGCDKDVPCFTNCCSDINILLTPLDVLNLARSQNISTEALLDKYTISPVTKDLNIPVLLLKMSDDDNKKCPFVTDEGCSIYESRPWSCRMYPLGMAIPPARAGVEPDPVFFLFEDDFCKGHSRKKEWTVAEWRKGEKVLEHEKLEAGYKGIVSHPWFIGGRKLDSKRMHMLYMACYDLDNFKRFVFESTFLERFELEDKYIEKMRNDDIELLNFSFIWLRYALFAEPTMTVRESASKPGSNS